MHGLQKDQLLFPKEQKNYQGKAAIEKVLQKL